MHFKIPRDEQGNPLVENFSKTYGMANKPLGKQIFGDSEQSSDTDAPDATDSTEGGEK